MQLQMKQMVIIKEGGYGEDGGGGGGGGGSSQPFPRVYISSQTKKRPKKNKTVSIY